MPLQDSDSEDDANIVRAEKDLSASPEAIGPEGNP